MWTWGSWCSHCVISQRLAGSPSPWSKPGISKPWTLLELQVGADNALFTKKGVLRRKTKKRWKKPIRPLIVFQCIMALLMNSLFSRSICESVPDVRGPEVEEKEDFNQAQHSQPSVQRSYCVRRPSWEHWPDQPAHRCHGLWSVGILVSFALSWSKQQFGVIFFCALGWDTMKWLGCAGWAMRPILWGETTGVKCWHTHASPLPGGTRSLRYVLLYV